MNQFITKIFLNIFIHTTMWIKQTTSSDDFFCFEKMRCIITTSPKNILFFFAAWIITYCWNIRPQRISTIQRNINVRFQIIATSWSRKIFTSWNAQMDISNRLISIKKKWKYFFWQSTWWGPAGINNGFSTYCLTEKLLTFNHSPYSMWEMPNIIGS